MKKQIEVGYIYPTQGGHGEVQILCTDLTEGYSVLGIRTDKHGGKHLYRCNSAGKCHYESIYGGDLILPDAEPEYRPWLLDEVPIGAILRYKSGENHGGRFMIIAVNKGVYVSDGTRHTTPELLFNFEIKSRGAWQPCGVQI